MVPLNFGFLEYGELTINVPRGYVQRMVVCTPSQSELSQQINTTNLTVLPLTAYWNLVVLRGGASEAPPKISRKESSLTPCCYIAFVCLYIQGSHANFRTEISKFERDFRILKFCEIEISHHIDKRKMAITRLILKIQD